MSVAALVALALASTAADAAAESPWQRSLRGELSGAAGWSDEAFAAASATASGRIEFGVFSITGTLPVRTPSEGITGLFTAGPGFAYDVGAWEGQASLLLGFRTHRFADRYGLGPRATDASVLGARLGTMRRLRPRSGRGDVLGLAFSATATWSGPVENRVRGVEASRFIGLLSVGLVLGLPIPTLPP